MLPMVTGTGEKTRLRTVATLIVRNLSEAERRQLRVAAAEEDMSVNKLVLSILRAWLHKRQGKQ
jgi:plasmid stability protein